jgi:DNA end-binding protein Ku
MAARAMWKGVVRFEGVSVPVKLYAAVRDRSIHFRLLDAEDEAPIEQAMVNPETGEVVPHDSIRRAFPAETGELVMLTDEELAALDPEPSRDVRVLAFLPPEVIDHRWYQRPYYLGPDGGETKTWIALVEALRRSGREGLARWVMRKKEYVGALRLHRGRPMLVSLRHADEVVSAAELDVPEGRAPDRKELRMAEQLVDMLADAFDPSAYRDEYRARVLELVETKARGGRVRLKAVKKRRTSGDLVKTLEASLARERKRA